ncbi:MAG: SO_0444 family Cu/Zn efflux transporter [Halobacteriovoraceae bacterium]|nr:SO_0444 family Cu/Zn efflux transporter [Halobacteriovoraceae bacterium]
MSEFISAVWKYLVLSSPFLLLGLFIAGIVHSFLPLRVIKKLFGEKKFSGVFKAALLGVPLPLCSCSVIPTAVELKKSGATNASTSSFLISTPESGIDSISVTYALMDFPMTILRPISAFLSAFLAGTLQFFFNKDVNQPTKETNDVGAHCCSKNKDKNEDSETFSKRAIKSLKYGYFDLLEDIAVWMSIGIIVSALIEIFIPVNFFNGLSGMTGRLLILVVGIPMYICASASTPIAASLILKGMSPGMGLIFLLVGPATNISNILVLAQYIGKKGVFINIISIVTMALIMGSLTDWLYLNFNIPIDFALGHDHLHQDVSLFSQLCAMIMCILLLRGLYIKTPINKLFKKPKKTCCHGN